MLLKGTGAIENRSIDGFRCDLKKVTYYIFMRQIVVHECKIQLWRTDSGKREMKADGPHAKPDVGPKG